MSRRNSVKPRSRAYLPNRKLVFLVASAAVMTGAYLVVLPRIPVVLRTPGSTPLYILGVISFVLFCLTFGFFVRKRTGAQSPPLWYIVHVAAGALGFLTAVVHSAGNWWSPPALMFIPLIVLIASGAYARLRINRDTAATFGNKLGGFASAPSDRRDAIRDLIKSKQRILERMDPRAEESVFSPTLRHWLRHPVLSFGYHGLSERERDLTEAHLHLPWAQVRWRKVHMALAALFAAGLLIHVIVVLFFAGYAADYGPVGWWHITAW